ncbi:MAG: diguanylate cyclase [Magnetococcales bacterium]|nr:diguanylate cyclase [Magnetococcales bacterium]
MDVYKKLPKQTILVVDDSPNNVRILSEILRQDHRILYATNGPDALETAKTQLPDLILLDIMMPEMDGYETCTKLKADPRTQEIPIIFITALDREQHETVGLELGGIDYLTKPINPYIVRLRVRNHLELKALRDHYKNLSAIDGLTGIANRRRFEEFLNQEWNRAVRSHSEISLIMMDIDCFKPYNDHYGHLAGDDTLRRIATTLKDTLDRPADLLARYGGEEFVCVLPETGREGAVLLGEKLRCQVVEQKIAHIYSAAADHVTLSLGLATAIPSQTNTPQELIEFADKNLYLAKEQGRNRLVS